MLVIPPRLGQIEEVGFDKFDPYPGGRFAIDTETTGLDMWGTYKVDRDVWPCLPFAFSLCDEDGNMAYIRWQIDPRTRRVVADPNTTKKLQKLLWDKKLAKIFHNYQFDGHMLTQAGFKMRGEFHDTQIRMHAINPMEKPLGLKPLAIKYLNVSDDDQKDLLKSVAKGRRLAKKNGWPRAEEPQGDYAMGDPELCRRYAELDAYRTMALFMAQEEFIEGAA